MITINVNINILIEKENQKKIYMQFLSSNSYKIGINFEYLINYVIIWFDFD
jgi:hypothetical protein